MDLFHIANYPWVTLVKHQPAYFQNEWNIELHGGMIDQKTKDKGDYTNFFREIDFNSVEKLKKDLFESS